MCSRDLGERQEYHNATNEQRIEDEDYTELKMHSRYVVREIVMGNLGNEAGPINRIGPRFSIDVAGSIVER